MEEDKTQEEKAEEIDASEEEPPVEGAKKPLSKADIGIFVFLGVMASLMIGAIVFVIYICTGSATGCNCPQCAGKVGMALREFMQEILR